MHNFRLFCVVFRRPPLPLATVAMVAEGRGVADVGYVEVLHDIIVLIPGIFTIFPFVFIE